MRNLILPAAQPYDPSAREVNCAICGTPVRVGDSYSIQFTFASNGPGWVSPNGRNPQCDAEQHFCCSEEHAVQAAHACLDEHLVPKHRAMRTAGLLAKRKTKPQSTQQKG